MRTEISNMKNSSVKSVKMQRSTKTISKVMMFSLSEKITETIVYFINVDFDALSLLSSDGERLISAIAAIEDKRIQRAWMRKSQRNYHNEMEKITDH